LSRQEVRYPFSPLIPLPADSGPVSPVAASPSGRISNSIGRL
jgi:hypothetical protein